MANLLDRASVVLTPTAYNNGEALCIKPDDGSGDFDFSRNSAATRVNAQGLVENVQILSSNLVQNGDFSEEGVQEVSNGSFSQESAELVINGSFDTDTDWVHRTSNSVISNGTLSWSGTQTLADDVYQQKTGYVGKLVKMTINISSYTQGSVFLRAGSSQSPTSHSSVGTFTEILEWVGNDYIYVKASSDFIGSIESVSVREVGQDWVLSGGVSIGSDKAIFNATSQTLLYQNISGTTQGTTYKVTYTISEYISGSIFFGFGNGITSPQGTIRNSDGTYTEYITKSDANISGGFRTSAFIGSITNISVKEVGMNWDLGSFTSIGNNVANIVNSTGELSLQQNIGVSQKTIKLTYTISNYASGAIRPQYGAVNGLTRSANGTYTEIITGISGSSNLAIFSVTTNTTATITNISVIEITSDTNLPRISYENFSYQDALGSEEVLNGGFDTNLNNWVAYSNTLISWESGGYALLNSNNNYWCKIKQSNVFEIGKTYKVILTAKSNRTDLNFHNSPITGSFSQADTFETFDQYYTATSTDFLFGYANAGSSTITIDNVSVKEYLGQEVVPNSGCGSWLFEPQSTNLVTQSETFSNWNTEGGKQVVTQNVAISPDGTQNGNKLVTYNGAVPGQRKLWTDFPVTVGASYTFSVYIKKVDGQLNTGFLHITSGANDTFDVSQAYTATDQWQRVSVTTNSAVSSQIRFLITGDANSQIYIWGAQVENLSYASSLIPTSGSSVTRNQDVCNNGGSLATINSTEGVLYLEASRLSDLGTCQIGLFGSSSNEQIRIEFNNSSIRAQLYNGSYQVNMTSSQTVTNNNKIAFKYKENDFALWINGVEVLTDNSGVTFNADELIKFNLSNGTGALPFFGKTKAVALFPYLSDSELQSLTTI